MIHILVGTNRPGSRSSEVAQILEGQYKDLG
ncbi:MAG: NADPH-dependent oxidoreductase, partial [Bdellovibrionales bacterium]|nr:NADPH-dependent oxidoreductase [Bdellovibrionales bacterium]